MQLIVPLGGDTPLESYSLSPYQLRPPKVRPHETHSHTAVNTLETFIHLLLLWEFFNSYNNLAKSARKIIFALAPWGFESSIKCDKISSLKTYMGKPHFPRKVDIMKI